MLSSFGRTSLVTAVVLLTFAISSAPAVAQSSARAGVSLTGADATLTQGSSTPWTLEKSGSVDGYFPNGHLVDQRDRGDQDAG